MSQAAAFRASPTHTLFRAWLLRCSVLLLLCGILGHELGAQLAAPIGEVPTEAYWSDADRQTYIDAKGKLDQGQVLSAQEREGLWNVCDRLALALRDPRYVTSRVTIRDLLVAADTHAVRAVVNHLLAANAPEEVRLHGIIALRAMADPVAPKDAILVTLSDPSPAVRLWAVRGAQVKGYADAGDRLSALALDDSPEVRLAAVEAVTALTVSGAEPRLVSMVEREAAGRQPLTDQLSKLEAEKQALEAKATRTLEEEMRLVNVSGDIVEVSGKMAFSNLLIYKAGEALNVLTSGAAGQQLKGYLSPEELQAVIDNLKNTYGSAPSTP